MKIKVNLESPILCLCEQGVDRSGAMKHELVIKRGYKNVLTAGTHTTTPETLRMLGNWAELIIVAADQSVWDVVPWDLKGKAVFENIGKDIWHRPDDPQLEKICQNIADKYKF